MKLKRISGYKDYFACDNGSIYSIKSGELKKLKPFVDGKGVYLMVSLCRDGDIRKFLVHRLIALAFIENDDPENKNTVDHIDGNTKNNSVDNLQWLSQRDNTVKGFKTRPVVRNYKTCSLWKDGCFIKYFRSIEEASRYASKVYGVSRSGLSKYKKVEKERIEIK